MFEMNMPGSSFKHLISWYIGQFVIVFFWVTITFSASAGELVWISGWKTTQHLTTPRAGAAGVRDGRNIYVIGGVDGKRFLRTVEMTSLNTNGEVKQWRASQPMNEARGFFRQRHIMDTFMWLVVEMARLASTCCEVSNGLNCLTTVSLAPGKPVAHG
ncbi:MAG TPA: hypothetical protein ENK06_13925 [Gammaproteobacteria bacterium]|nr:hypothetical protein [Gammaproteobacteria bacterium]